MINVLCSSCNTHLADTDVGRLDFPLRGEMFTVVYQGWYLRPEMLNLDIFCPVCGRFPFHYDPYTAGFNAVGKALTVRDGKGEAVVMTVKQLLMSDSREPAPLSQGENITGKEIKERQDAAEADVKKIHKFPCPVCGAKKRFHKKGCALTQTEQQNPEPVVLIDKDARKSQKLDEQRAKDPFIQSLSAKISGVKGVDKGDGPVTEEEISQMVAERENRRLQGENKPNLRHGEGYSEKRT